MSDHRSNPITAAVLLTVGALMLLALLVLTARAAQFPDGGGVKLAAVPFPDDPAPQIIGGMPLEPDQWPFVVHVYGNSGYSPCTGTLIAPDWVLTAAHCVNNVKDDGISTVLNMAPVRDALGPDGHTCNIDFSRLGCGPFTRTKRIIIHPLYQGSHSLSFPDIALIEVDWRLWFPAALRSDEVSPPSTGVRILNIEEEARYAPPGTPAVQVGLRDTHTRGLAWVDGQILRSAAECRANSDWGSGITDDAMCVGYEHITRVGDSGGPVLVSLPDGTYAQVGVHNLGAGGGVTRPYPAVATRTAAVYDWISQYVSFPDWRVTQETHFPFFASGQGWETEFVILNPSDEAVEAEMLFFTAGGNPVPVTEPLEFTVLSGGLFTVPSPAGTPAVLNSGSALVRSQGALHGFTRFRTGGTPWLGARGTAVIESVNAMNRPVVAPAKIGQEQTYVTIRNPSPEGWVHIRLSLVSTGGTVLSEKSAIYIPPNGRYVKNLNALFPEYVTDGLQLHGTVIIDTVNDAPVWVGAFEIGPGVFNGVPVSLSH